MKITKSQLKRIIKEEKQKLLNEFYGDNVDTGSPLIEFARAYMGLGNVIADQVDAVVAAYITGSGGAGKDGFTEAVYEQNANAIDRAHNRLFGVLRYGELGDEGDVILEALEAARKVYAQGDEEVESDAMAAANKDGDL
tara:strand:- start:1073 stop:1489 length:417 start_codon:yes stop_codon:yes gene_type:complete